MRDPSARRPPERTDLRSLRPASISTTGGFYSALGTSLETWQIGLAVAGHRTTGEDPLSRGLIGGLLLDHRGLVSLLARHIRHHQLPEFHELLNLLVAHLTEDVQRLHLAVSGLRHAFERTDDRLFTLHLLAL